MSQIDLDFDAPPGVCELCGSKVVEYRHSLNKARAAFLLKLAEAGAPASIPELRLTNSQYGNYSLVRHWGLAEHVPPASEIEQRKGGKWRLTKIGLDFVRGEFAAWKYIHIKRNQLIKSSGPLIHINEINDGYLYRGDYRDQAREQLR